LRAGGSRRPTFPWRRSLSLISVFRTRNITGAFSGSSRGLADAFSLIRTLESRQDLGANSDSFLIDIIFVHPNSINAS
jgi:hypothetical protein